MRISAASDDAKAQFHKCEAGKAKNGQNRLRNANDHEQQARVHPARPSHSVVVPAPELSSIDVAVGGSIGTVRAFRKRRLRQTLPVNYCGTSLTTGPLTGGGAGCSTF